jgi:hypothetical protein
MTSPTEGYQIGLIIVAGMASKLEMMYLEILHDAATLTSPAVPI